MASKPRLSFANYCEFKCEHNKAGVIGYLKLGIRRNTSRKLHEVCCLQNRLDLCYLCILYSGKILENKNSAKRIHKS